LQRIDVGEKEYAGGWVLRAGTILASFGELELLSDHLPHAIRLAESFQRAGKLNEAVQVYERAGHLAREGGDTDRAFELALTMAAIQAQAGRNEQAVEALRQLTAAAPHPAKAAHASLLAAHVLRRIWDQDKAPAALHHLRQHLTQHLQQYGRDPTAIETHVLAGYVDAVAGQWRSALTHYEQVPADHRLFATAVQEMIRAYEGLRATASKEEAGQLTAEAAASLTRREQDLAAKPGHSSTRLELRLARAGILTHLNASPAELQQAREDLEMVLKHPEASVVQRATARQRLPLVLLGLGKSEEAGRLLREIVEAETLTQIQQTLRRWSEQATEEQRQGLASLQLITIRQLQAMAPKMPAAQRQAGRREEAWALARAGSGDEARRLFTELRKEAPRDGRLAEEHARALMHLGSAADLTEAIAIWQMLAARHQAGTAAWFESRYQLAVALHRSGQPDRALQVLRVTCVVWLNEPKEQLDSIRRDYRSRFLRLEKKLSP
jgi:tetratricopeptide (TPR) repeat protein